MNRGNLIAFFGIILITFLVTFLVAQYLAPTEIYYASIEEPTMDEENQLVSDTHGTSTTTIAILESPIATATPPVLTKYIEVTDGCGPYFQGTCLNVRSGPGTTYPVVRQLRTGTVLRTSEATTTEDQMWYKIVFNEWLRYPERITEEWFVSAKYVHAFEFEDPVHEYSTTSTTSTSKRIIVDRSDQKLYAYDGDVLFMEETVSTGIELSPTPRGVFTIFKKTPSRYMQGPLPDISEDYYDLPGVPWTLYFTEEGAAIHGAYWHNNFGQQWSHGCVNLPTDKAQELYNWADTGTPVTVRD